ncbi:MAG: hypothetical protein VB858_08610, partial [Planctomycetaceae bacterium]
MPHRNHAAYIGNDCDAGLGGKSLDVFHAAGSTGCFVARSDTAGEHSTSGAIHGDRSRKAIQVP